MIDVSNSNSALIDALASTAASLYKDLHGKETKNAMIIINRDPKYSVNVRYDDISDQYLIHLRRKDIQVNEKGSSFECH